MIDPKKNNNDQIVEALKDEDDMKEEIYAKKNDEFLLKQRMKKLTYNLNKQKFEASLKKDDTSNIEENDGIVIIDED